VEQLALKVKEADEVRRTGIDELNCTYITSFDRTDIFTALSLENNFGVSTGHRQRAKALQNNVEQVYREAIADLFSRTENIKHVMEMLKMRRSIAI